MKRLIALAGLAALLGWTGLGLVAWSMVARRATVTFADEQPAEPAERPWAELEDDVGALQQDVRALAAALETNLEALRTGLAAELEERAAHLERRVDALRDELASRSSSLPADEPSTGPADLRDARDVSAPQGSELGVRREPEISAAGPPRAESAAAPARASFLAFKLPSDDFRFDERRTWAVLPALSRVGFDAKTTLHDFSGATSAIQGELQANLARPSEEPRLHLSAEAAGLATGDAERDAAMREHLATAEHPALEFELTRFEPEALEAERGSGRAHGRLSIRGVTREVVMNLRYSLDDARRLCVEGEMALDLEDFEVPVPSKLGLISMEPSVRVWISLRLRVAPRTQG